MMVAMDCGGRGKWEVFSQDEKVLELIALQCEYT